MKTNLLARLLWVSSIIAAVMVIWALHGRAAANRAVTPANGAKAPAFEATTTDGKAVKFPDDYKGKVVLLDFWATWCPPCREEVPNVVKVYEKYHGQGLDVLGVSLDRTNAADTLAKYVQDNHMTWPQIYEQGKSDLATKYGIEFIPYPIIVDGDTGTVLYQADKIRGSALAPAVEKALAAKKK
jgi:thiol-disulfide isomerase/thioredoxin